VRNDCLGAPWVETILEKLDLAIRLSGVPSASASLILLALTTLVDRAQRDRNPARLRLIGSRPSSADVSMRAQRPRSETPRSARR
jgi:hypothetical protein